MYDVAVDVRAGSPTFGKWIAVELSAENCRQIFIPAGFAHGFCVLSERVIFTYKCSRNYAPSSEGGVLFSDPDLGIPWPGQDLQLSEKDRSFPCTPQSF